MPETSETLPLAETFARPEALLRVPVGLASPLWGLFAGAAVGGSAWWWMTRWARPENLEALFGATAESMAAAVEAVEEEVAAVESVIEPPVLAAPVGGESAPIGPAVAAELTLEATPEAEPEPAPKPKPRRAEPKAD